MPTYQVTLLEDARAAVEASGITRFRAWPPHGSAEDFACWIFNQSPRTMDTYDLAAKLGEYVKEVEGAEGPIGQLAEAVSMDETLADVNDDYHNLAQAVGQVRASKRGTVVMKAIARMATAGQPLDPFVRLKLKTKQAVVAALDLLSPSATAITNSICFAYSDLRSPESDFLVRMQCWKLDRLLLTERKWGGDTECYFAEASALAELAANVELRAECTRLLMKGAIAAAAKRSTGRGTRTSQLSRKKAARL